MRDFLMTLAFVILSAGAGIGVATGLAFAVFASVAGAAIVFIAAKSLKLFLCVATISIMMSPSLERWSGSSVVGMLDEAAVLLVVVFVFIWRLSSGEALRGFPGGRYFALYGVLGVASALVASVPNTVWLPALMLAVKGLLVGWAFAQLNWSAEDVRRVSTIGGVVIVVLAACAVVNFAAPVPWARLVGTTNYVDFRYGLPSINGPFVHPAAFGRVMALLALGVLAYSAAFGSSSRTRLLVVLASVSALASFRRKTIIGLLAASAMTKFWASKASTIIATLLIVPLVMAVLWAQIRSTVSATVEDYVIGAAARTRLTLDSVTIASERFPFGAGFGRFGSSVARDYYSPEYVKLGYVNVFGMGPNANVSFLTDTQWAAILGESGWLGALAFAAGLVCVLRKGLAHRRSGDETTRYIALIVVAWFVLLLIESIAAPVYTSAPSYPLLFSAVGVLLSLGDRRKVCLDEAGVARCPKRTTGVRPGSRA